MDEKAAAVLLNGWDEAELNRREILAFIGDGEDCYVEGYSPRVYVTEGGSGWFCFEAGFNESWVHLLHLGFTPNEIKEARK